MDADACARLGHGNCSHAGECFTSSMAVSPGLPMVVQHGGPWECLTSSYPGRSAVPCQAMPSHRRSGCKERHATDARVLRRRGRSQIISTQMARQPPRPSGNGGPMGAPTVVELPEQSAGAAACHAASNTNAPGWAGRLSCSPVSPPSLASWPASRLPIPCCCCCYSSSLLSLPLPEPAPRPKRARRNAPPPTMTQRASPIHAGGDGDRLRGRLHCFWAAARTKYTLEHALHQLPVWPCQQTTTGRRRLATPGRGLGKLQRTSLAVGHPSVNPVTCLPRASPPSPRHAVCALNRHFPLSARPGQRHDMPQSRRPLSTPGPNNTNPASSPVVASS